MSDKSEAEFTGEFWEWVGLKWETPENPGTLIYGFSPFVDPWLQYSQGSVVQ